jgi:anaerobic ribonucleoside-triphosphate reductase activating protein
VTWDFNYGKLFTKETEDEILSLLSRNYIDGLSLLGGEPMEPCNQRCLVNLVDRFKEKYPNKTLWIYTGYTYDEDLIPGGKAYCEATDRILDQCDVMVDGEFIESLKDISLKFRGSSDQRILNIRETRKRNAIVFW